MILCEEISLSADIKSIVKNIMPDMKEYQVKQVFDGDYPKNVFIITSNTEKYVLKVAGQYEVDVYENYLMGQDFDTPVLLGKYKNDEGTTFIMISFIEGNDLCRYCTTYAIEAAKSIAKIHNSYFTDQRNDIRYINYLKRISKRAECLKDEPVLKKAYQYFLDRQQTIPLTVCNGDYLPVNAIYDGEKVNIIDWGFSGYMPYALDVARMIAHGVDEPTEETFDIIMHNNDKEIFLKTYFELINLPISENEFRHDVLLAKLNEYVEFVEVDINDGYENVKDSFYYKAAMEIAEEILKNS